MSWISSVNGFLISVSTPSSSLGSLIYDELEILGYDAGEILIYAGEILIYAGEILIYAEPEILTFALVATFAEETFLPEIFCWNTVLPEIFWTTAVPLEIF